MENFSEILNDLIIESGLSLRKLATQSNVSAIQYSKYLRGVCPSIDVVVRIANYFDCSVDYLFGLSDKKSIKHFDSYNLTVFVDRYKECLEQNNISHWKFAQKYGLSESALRHWQYGDSPSIASLVTIAKNLSVSIDYLIGRTNNK